MGKSERDYFKSGFLIVTHLVNFMLLVLYSLKMFHCSKN